MRSKNILIASDTTLKLLTNSIVENNRGIWALERVEKRKIAYL